MKNRRVHHFVPQFLLKKISNSKNRIAIYNHKRDKIYWSRIDREFAVWDLNTIKDSKGNPDYNSIEDIFNEEFEKKTSNSINAILEYLLDRTQTFKLTYQDYANILRFFIVTRFRTPFMMNKVKHAMLVNVYAVWYADQYLKEKNFDNDLLEKKKIGFNIDKQILYSYLVDFEKMFQNISDLKLTIFTHNFDNEYFLLPDQGVVAHTLFSFHLGSPDLKLYMPISSKVLFCFERVSREINTRIIEIPREGIKKQNQYVLQNFYDYIGCEDLQYLDQFIRNNIQLIRPLKKFDPCEMKEDIKKIKSEIIEKLGEGVLGNAIQTHINHENEFKILCVTSDE